MIPTDLDTPKRRAERFGFTLSLKRVAASEAANKKLARLKIDDVCGF